MSIQSTIHISRTYAIAHILLIHGFKVTRNYDQIGRHSFEPDEDLRQFVDLGEELDLSNIHNWTDRMLSEQMDKPFYRRSMFENYIIGDET